MSFIWKDSFCSHKNLSHESFRIIIQENKMNKSTSLIVKRLITQIN